MRFLIIMINVFALAAFVVLWLSISFIAVDIYKTNKVITSAVSLARISIILKRLLLVWFILLGIAFTTADNLLPLVLYLVLFGGLYFYIFKMYGNILGAVTAIRKDDGTKAKHELIHNTVVKIERTKQSVKNQADFVRFKKYFWGLNGLICAGTLLNFWLMDTGGSPFWEVAIGSVMMIILLQVLFLPIYFIVKRIVFATLTEK